MRTISPVFMVGSIPRPGSLEIVARTTENLQWCGSALPVLQLRENSPDAMPRGRVAMKVRILILSVAVVLMPIFTFGQGAKPAANKPAASHIVTPDQLVWKPLIPGVESAVV